MTRPRPVAPLIVALCAFAPLGALLPAAAAGGDDRRPNIIVVFIDDMGFSDFSCFGGPTETQHVDRLAREGIRFTNFYVNSPICSPSRVALTTGQYPHRHRITSYLNNRRSNKERGMAQWLDPAAPTLARELQKAGYATGHFGKWHMGGQRDVADAPPISAYGFDASLTNFEGMGPKLLPLTLKPDPGGGEPIPGRIWADAERLGEGFVWMQRSEITTGFVDAGLAFIDRAQADGKPFFINLWPDDVHGPFWPPLDKWGGDKRALYRGVLDAMDEQFAKLFDRVRDDPELRDNTIITVCSDNGHEPGAGESKPFRGAKTWTYEGGIRSPLIVWAPGLIAAGKAGATNDTSVFSAIDLNRSLYRIAGIEPAAELDGEDVSAALLGKSDRGRAAPIFWRRPPDRPGFGHGFDEDNPDLAAREGKWKYLVNIDGGDPQLYDLVADPGESEDLAAAEPEVAARLHAAVMGWNAAMPKDASDPGYTAGALPPDHFVNPIGEGADPWVVRDAAGDRYLWCFSEGNRGIAVHASDRLTAFGEKRVVWRAPAGGPVSREIWAPELHHLDGRWTIYFAASDGRNENHLAYALRAKTDDPLGEYELHGPFATGDGADGRAPNVWAIDMTPLEHGGGRYALWSGWDAPGTDRQFLYIAPMKSPTELAGPRVRLCANDDHPWEFTEGGGRGRGLNEGPQVLKHGGRTFVTYSCGGSWLPTYKLGLLELVGDDPLDPASWKKFPRPVFQSTPETFGVGHSCFVRSPNGDEHWHIFHAKRDREPGWRRAVFVQPMQFGRNGLPQFGKPVPWGEATPRPGGEPPLSELELPLRRDLRDGAGFDYYGHHQFYAFTEAGLRMGHAPGEPTNAYRSGEKVVLRGTVAADFTAAVTLDFGGGAEGRGAGILFRLSGPSVGHDAHRGYFAGVKPSEDAVLLGKMDGRGWQELKRAPYPIDVNKPHRLEVTAQGDRIRVALDGQPALDLRDPTHRAGTVGLRTTDIPVTFTDLEVRP